jgi:hypothetical protein
VVTELTAAARLGTGKVAERVAGVGAVAEGAGR